MYMPTEIDPKTICPYTGEICRRRELIVRNYFPSESDWKDLCDDERLALAESASHDGRAGHAQLLKLDSEMSAKQCMTDICKRPQVQQAENNISFPQMILGKLVRRGN